MCEGGGGGGGAGGCWSVSYCFTYIHLRAHTHTHIRFLTPPLQSRSSSHRVPNRPRAHMHQKIVRLYFRSGCVCPCMHVCVRARGERGRECVGQCLHLVSAWADPKTWNTDSSERWQGRLGGETMIGNNNINSLNSLPIGLYLCFETRAVWRTTNKMTWRFWPVTSINKRGYSAEFKVQAVW